MNDKLLRDVGIVFAFWFVILYILSGFPVSFIPDVLTGSLLIWVIGLGFGGCAAWMVAYGTVEADRRGVTGKERSDDASASIMDADDAHSLYQVRLPQPEPAALGKAKNNPLHNEPWWASYRKNHPAYAHALNEVYALMQSKPGLPAGYNGGHGDTSLVQHSMHVVRAMLRAAPSWSFEGIKGRNGQVVVPLADASGALASVGSGTPDDCPLLPLLAFAHDIGKVECFIQGKDGQIVQVIPAHGRRGAALLRRLPSLWRLPRPDRQTLLLAVEFYHGLSQLPISRWVGDRTRSMTALLYLADCEASAEEGFKPDEAEAARAAYAAEQPAPAPTKDNQCADTTVDDTESEDPAPPATSTPDESFDAADLPYDGSVAADDQVPGAEPEPESPLVAARSSAPAKPNDDDVVLDNGATLMDALIETLRMPDAINGKNSQRRVAFKYGGWVFVLATAFSAAFTRFSGSKLSRDYTKLLLKAIDDQDALLTKAGGRERKPEAALWNLVLARPGDEVDAPPSHPGFVFRTHLIPGLDSFEDCAYCPAIKVGRSLVRIEAEKQVPTQTGDAVEADGEDEGEGDGAHPPLTARILSTLGQLEEDTHGRVIKESPRTGVRAALFNRESLLGSYSFDPEALPKDIITMTNKDGTQFVGVVL